MQRDKFIMNVIRLLVAVALVGSGAAALTFWKRAEDLAEKNAALRAELDTLKSTQAAATADSPEARQREYELKRLRADAEEVHKLRGELNPLRAGARDLERLRAENLQLRGDNQQLRTANASAAATPSAAAPRPAADQFPRAGWSFAGYTTPEAALVSSIWAMREGNPQTYLQSLSPEEQARSAKAWQDKPEAEIIAKHQSDVASITGLRVLERQEVSPNEVVMSVYIEGVGRMEKVSMKLVGNEWKFGGYIRPPGK